MNQQNKSMIKLHGQTAIVTGASSAIGASIAKELGSAGASVLVNFAGNKQGADEVVGHIKDRAERPLRSGPM